MPQLMMKASGQTIPLWEMHGGYRDDTGRVHDYPEGSKELAVAKNAGYVQPVWNEEKDALVADVYVTSDPAISKVEAGTYKALSLGVWPTKVTRYADFDSVDDGTWEEVSLVDVPGIPEAGFVKVTEAFEAITVSEPQGSITAGVASSASKTGEMASATAQHLAAGADVQASQLATVKEADLTAEQRDNLSDSKFAYVDSNGEGHLPIENPEHIRAAMSRFNQTHFESESAKAAAKRKICRAAAKHGIEGDFCKSTESGNMNEEKKKEEDTTPKNGTEGNAPANSGGNTNSNAGAGQAPAQQPDMSPGKGMAALKEEYASLAADVRKLEATMAKQGENADSARKEWVEVAKQMKEVSDKLAAMNATPSAPQRHPIVETSGSLSNAPTASQMEQELGVDAADLFKIAASLVSARGNRNTFGVSFPVKKLDLPALGRGKAFEETWSKRFETFDDWSLFPGKVKEAYQKATEAGITTATANVPMAVEGVPPLVVVPSDLIAQLRDTVVVQQVAQGANKARFGTIAVPTFGTLSESTDPGDVTQAFTTVDVSPSEVGVEQEMSYRAIQQITGDVFAAVVQSFRVSELVYEDNQILSTLDTGLTNKSYQGQTAEASITSSNTFTAAFLSGALKSISSRGIFGNLVAVLHPVQFDALLNDSNIQRYVQYYPPAIIASGLIPNLFGIEIRRSTQSVTGSGAGSPAITTYHAPVYKKQYTAGMGITQDLMIEVFRKIWTSSTLVKAYADYAFATIVPKAGQTLVSA